MDSHIPNSPFNAPGQAVKVGGNTTQVNIRCGGPLVPQKLLYIVLFSLLRFDKTDGKIVAYSMEPEGRVICCYLCKFKWRLVQIYWARC